MNRVVRGLAGVCIGLALGGGCLCDACPPAGPTLAGGAYVVNGDGVRADATDVSIRLEDDGNSPVEAHVRWMDSSGDIYEERWISTSEHCGDGWLASEEACDDGNGDNGDGCSGCEVEVCYNGHVDEGEACDEYSLACSHCRLPAVLSSPEGPDGPSWDGGSIAIDARVIRIVGSEYVGGASRPLFDGVIDKPAGMNLLDDLRVQANGSVIDAALAAEGPFDGVWLSGAFSVAEPVVLEVNGDVLLSPGAYLSLEDSLHVWSPAGNVHRLVLHGVVHAVDARSSSTIVIENFDQVWIGGKLDASGGPDTDLAIFGGDQIHVSETGFLAVRSPDSAGGGDIVLSAGSDVVVRGDLHARGSEMGGRIELVADSFLHIAADQQLDVGRSDGSVVLDAPRIEVEGTVLP